MKINLLTVCTDWYPLEYANKLVNRLQQVSQYDISNYCITDRDIQFAEPIQPKLPPGSGWWNKTQLFDIDGPSGWNLYMDIDIVIINEFDRIIDHVIHADKRDTITCVSDAIGWMDNKFSSSWMMFHRGAGADISTTFMADSNNIMKQPGGDQVWIGKTMQPKIEYIDETFPNLKKNLKFDLGSKTFSPLSSTHPVRIGKWQFPTTIDKRVSLVDCGGKPKPHELEQLDYIKRNWHDVRI
jgi:hypothetical protein